MPNGLHSYQKNEPKISAVEYIGYENSEHISLKPYSGNIHTSHIEE